MSAVGAGARAGVAAQHIAATREDLAPRARRLVGLVLRDVLFGGEQVFQVLGVAVADADLARGVLLRQVRVEPLAAVASVGPRRGSDREFPHGVGAGYLAAIMHEATRFCSPGWRPHAVDPSVWTGVRQLAVQPIGD